MAVTVKRKSIVVPGQTPNAVGVPHVARMGDYLFSSNISGRDAADGTRELDPARQIVNAFANLCACLEASGGTPENVGFVNIWVTETAKGLKQVLNAEWSKLFPGENAPARHTVKQIAPGFLAADTHIELSFIAKIGAKREVFNVAGKPPHDSPIPDVAKIDNLLFSSVFTGHKKADGSKEKHPVKQMINNYANFKAHLAAAGADLDDVAYVRNYIRYRNNRPLMNDVWMEMYGPTYPNSSARDTFIAPNLTDYVEIQSLFRAVVGSRREAFQMQTDWARAHAEPIADVAKFGDILFTSRIGGQELIGDGLVDDADPQLSNAFVSLQEHLAGAGITHDDIGLIEMWVSDPQYMPIIDREWQKAFPADNGPARVAIFQPTLGPGLIMKMEFVAVV